MALLLGHMGSSHRMQSKIDIMESRKLLSRRSFSTEASSSSYLLESNYISSTVQSLTRRESLTSHSCLSVQ